MVRFRVGTSRSGRWRTVTFVVYDAVEELQRAGSRYRGEPEGEFSNALGLSQPRAGADVNAETGAVRRFAGAGCIRLFRGQMGVGVLSHECFHMALAIYREDFGDYQDIRYARDDDEAHRSLAVMDNEEILCHIADELISKATRKLYQLGVY